MMNISERKRVPFVRKMIAAVLAASLVAGVVFCFNIYNDKIAIPAQSEQTNAASSETDIALKPDSSTITPLDETATAIGEVISTGRYFEMVTDDGLDDIQEMFSPSNVNSPANNYTIAFGGSEWLVVGGKDGEGKDVITGNAETTNGTGKSIAVASLPNNALTILKKSIDGDAEKYRTTNNLYSSNNSMNYAGSYVQAKLNSLVSELSATERAFILKRTLQGGSGTLGTYVQNIENGSDKYWTQANILARESAASTGDFYPPTGAARRLIGEGPDTPHPNPVDLYAFATLRQSHGYTGTYKPDNVADASDVANQEYWELSVAEAALMPEEILDFGFTVAKGSGTSGTIGQGYWLRTPGSNQWYTDKMMSFVMYYDLTDDAYDTYYIDYMGSPVSFRWQPLLSEGHVRPAAFLDVSKLLYTIDVDVASSRVDEGSAAYDDDGDANHYEDGVTQKLIMRDDQLSFDTALTTVERVGESDSTEFEIHFAGAAVGENIEATYVRDGEVLYTWLLDADGSGSSNTVPAGGSGTATIDLSCVTDAEGNTDTREGDILNVCVSRKGTEGYHLGFASALASFKLQYYDPMEDIPGYSPEGFLLSGIESTVFQGDVLDIEGFSQSAGASIIAYPYHTGANQRWWIEPVDDKYYRIKAIGTGQYLDVVDALHTGDGGTMFAGNFVIQKPLDENSLSQQWQFVSLGDRIWGIASRKNTALYIIPTPTVSAGQNRKMILSLNTDYAGFRVYTQDRIDDGVYRIEAVSNQNLVLSVQNSSTASGALLKLAQSTRGNETLNQLFYIEFDDETEIDPYTDSYTIENVNSGRMVTTSPWGQNVSVYQGNYPNTPMTPTISTDWNTRFVFEQIGDPEDGIYAIHAGTSGYYIGISGGQAATNANIVTGTNRTVETSTVSQQWRLIRVA